MKNVRCVTTLLALVCIFVIVCNAAETTTKSSKSSKKSAKDGKSGDQSVKKQGKTKHFTRTMADPKSCGTYMMEKPPVECCAIPHIVPKEVFKGCWADYGFSGRHNLLRAGKKRSGAGAGAGKTKSARSKRATPALNSKNSGNMKKSVRSGELYNRGPGCLMECVMKNQSLLNSDGMINKEKVTESFSKNVEGTFVGVVEKAVEVCYDLYKDADHKATSATNCKQTIAQFMTCARKEMELNCPADFKTNGSADVCTNRVEGLKKCDPFYVNTELQEKIAKMAKSMKLNGKPKKPTTSAK